MGVSSLFRAIKERDFNGLDMADDRVVSVEASGGNADVRSVKDSGIAGETCNPFIKWFTRIHFPSSEVV